MTTASCPVVAAAHRGGDAFLREAISLARELESARASGACAQAGQLAAAIRAAVAQLRRDAAAKPRWYVSARAVHEWAKLQRLPSESDEDFAQREEELMAAAAAARHVRDQANGLQLWRLPRPHQYRLMVSPEPRPEGDLAQLVSVLAASEAQIVRSKA